MEGLENGEVKEVVTVKKIFLTTLEKIEICLFCNKESLDFEANLSHMFKDHSFFIADERFDDY